MSDPEPPPGTPGPTEQDARGVSPVVWIGLAALLIAGGVYAYSVFVPPEMPKDGMVEQTPGESAPVDDPDADAEPVPSTDPEITEPEITEPEITDPEITEPATSDD
ncbi:hypothetical protein [Alienimonas californiensis]|uniref:Uncharacterized protein n=1 Tax=Alienimonas californiensis TaxID=2527989 RepID=A0A517PCN6_9PLAN|nr:hypothetical protein [Alienimonas californiensis]QDT17143.1 hypothetical protein CA12_32550 [Alienimonas californiensis]